MDKKNKALATRKLIIDKATVLFTKNGYNKTSLTDILEATGLAKGGFYFHFKSKECLAKAVIEALDDCWTQDTLPKMMQGGNAREKLNLMFSLPGDCCRCPQGLRPTILLLNLATEMLEVNEVFVTQLQQIFKRWLLVLADILDEGKEEKLFKPGIDSSAVAGIILSNIMGANLLALLNGKSEMYYKQIGALNEVLFEGISLK